MKEGYRLTATGIGQQTGPILSDLHVEFPDRAVTMLVGPGGTGKTSLLRALSGQVMPEGLNLTGEISLRELPRTQWALDDIHFEPQQRKGAPASHTNELIHKQASVLLLDEPERSGLHSQRLSEIEELLNRQRDQGLCVVVTHNLDLIRRCADHVGLLCAGRLDCFTDRHTFLTHPPTALAAQFVKQGNCWPKRSLPSHFHWVRPGLAGMGRPGLLGDIDTDLAAIADQGVDLLVSLTERRFPQEKLRVHGITGKHLPIADMSIPPVNAAASICADTARALANGSHVAFHCEAGLGRTGTMLAAYLTWTGSTAEAAITEVRTVIRGAIQTESQVSFIERFASAFGGRPSC